MSSDSIKIHVLKKEIFDNSVAKFVAGCSEQCLAENDLFYIAVSGGSMPNVLANGLRLFDVEWTKWRILFADERVVPFNDVESTFKSYKELLIGKLPLTDANFITIDPSLPVTCCAEDYAKKIRELFPGHVIPKFDLILLGMGPDGHTASLFPDHPLLQETSRLVAAISDSPKPPPCRVTLTLPVINAAKNVAFICTGANKADVVKRVVERRDRVLLPAAMVKPTDGSLNWFLDEAAAGSLEVVC